MKFVEKNHSRPIPTSPSGFEPLHDGRIYIEKINRPLLFSSSSGIRAGYTARLEPFIHERLAVAARE